MDSKPQSLANYLGTAHADTDSQSEPRLEDIADAKVFALAVLNSREFRQYIVNGLTLGSIPPAVLTRLMDNAWGKPVDRVEHTGEGGGPVVTEIRRVIVRAPQHDEDGDAERISIH